MKVIDAGDRDQAAKQIFRRFTDRLIALARSRLSERIKQKVDPEDVVQSAYRSFFRGLQEAAAIYRDILANGALDALRTRHNLASALWQAGSLEEAEAEFRNLLSQYDDTQSPDALNSLNLLASVLADQQQHVEAEALYREALAGRVEILGSNHPHTLSTMRKLTRLLMRQEKYSDALPLLHECLELHIERFGPDRGLTFGVRTLLADCLKGLGRFDESERIRIETYEILKKGRGADHAYTRQAAEQLK